MQVACVNQARVSDPVAFDFRVQAAHTQMVRDFLPRWAGHLSQGQEPWPCVNYLRPPTNPRDVHPIFEMDDVGVPDALGYHDDLLDFVYGRTLVPANPDDATTLTHEVMEMRADPQIDLWRTYPDGRGVALEVGDPVEADQYAIDVAVLGQTRRVWVSNFVLPAWFELGSRGPWDHMGLLDGPFQMTPGGYLILRDGVTGEIENVFAEERAPIGRLAAKNYRRKLADPHSRTHRRLHGPSEL